MTFGFLVRYLFPKFVWKLPSRIEWIRVQRWLTVIVVLLVSAWLGRQAQMRLMILLGGGVGVIILTAVCIKSMRTGLTLLVIGAPFFSMGPGTGTNAVINITMLLVAGLVVLWLIKSLLLEHRMVLQPSIVNLPLLAFLIAGLVSWLWGYVVFDWRISPPDNFLYVQVGQYAIFALLVATFFLAANYVVDEATLRLWMIYVVGIGIILMLMGLLDFPIERYIIQPGMMYVWPLIFITAQVLFNVDQRRKWLLIFLLSSVIWITWIVQITLSWKSGWIPTLVSLLILLVLYFPRPEIGLLGVVSFVSLLFLLPLDIMKPLLLSEGQSGSLERPLLWYDVLRMTQSSPVLGLGPITYMLYWQIPEFIPVSRLSNWYAWTQYGFQPPSHNSFIDIYAQTGLIGLGLFLWALIAGIWTGWRLFRRLPPGFLRAYVAAVVAGLFGIGISSFILGDWLVPFVYNIGLQGYRQALYSWLFMGTLVMIDRQLVPRVESADAAGAASQEKIV